MMSKLSRFLRENGINYRWVAQRKFLIILHQDNMKHNIDFPPLEFSYDPDIGYMKISTLPLPFVMNVSIEFECGSVETAIKKMLRYGLISVSQIKKLNTYKHV